jgi:Na+-translocating ferredoxin:NAD+ oxidoreductase RnfG subunit
MPGQAENTSRAEQLRSLSVYPVLYMFCTMFFFSAVLIGLARFTHDRVEANRQIFVERAVLQAVGVALGPDAGPERIHRLFTERIEQPDETSRAYRLVSDGTVKAYAVPFEGQGFWNTIRGIVGMAPDGETLTGLAIYEQSETPGLGAEIVKPDFTGQFRKLTLGTAPPVHMAPPGTALEAGQVHAVTGATQTCTRLEDMLNRTIRAWQAASRKGGAS